MTKVPGENENGMYDLILDARPGMFSGVEQLGKYLLNKYGSSPASGKSFFSMTEGGDELSWTAGFSDMITFGQTAIGLSVSADKMAELASDASIARTSLNVVFDVPHNIDIGPAAVVENTDNWGYDALKTREFHDHGFQGSGVRVGVLDSGVDADHDCFRNGAIAKFRYFDEQGNAEDRQPSDSQWHGTHVTSVIVGVDDGNKRGLAPEAKVFHGQVLNEWQGSIASIKQGLIWMRDEVKPDILNLSLGWPGIHDEWALEIRQLCEAGTIVVVAAGNEYLGPKKHRSPANYVVPGLISVGAVTESGEIWNRSGGGDFVWDENTEFSNARSQLPLVSAPGVDIVSASSGSSGAHRKESGTSMAAPHISGLLAILLSVPSIDKQIAERLLKASLLDLDPAGFDVRFGLGSVSGEKLLNNVINHIDSN